MPIKYVEGDLFQNVPDNGVITLIPHICNNIRAWGAGFVVPLGKHYPKAKESYLKLEEIQLGTTQFVECEHGVCVANMIGQQGIGSDFIDGKDVPPIRYDALRACMFDVKKKVFDYNHVQIKCPMFGSGLAGGDWNKIEGMIYEIWNEYDVTIYYFPQFLPKGFEPVDRTDKDITQEIRVKEQDAIYACNVSLFDLSKAVVEIENNPWPHTNRNCDIHVQEALAALREATIKVEALKSTLMVQEIQEKHFE